MIEKIDLTLGDFEKEEDRKGAIIDLQLMMKSAGWQFIQRVLTANLQVVEDEIFDPETPEAKRQPRLIARMYLKKLLALPNDQIAKFGGTPGVEYNPDPFHTVESIGKPPEQTD